jgi:predicted HTH domain antitoxin
LEILGTSLTFLLPLRGVQGLETDEREVKSMSQVQKFKTNSDSFQKFNKLKSVKASLIKNRVQRYTG